MIRSTDTSNRTIRNNGSTTAARSTLVAGSDGTNQRPIKTDTLGRVYTTSEVTSPYPSIRQASRTVLASGATKTTTAAISQDTAIKEFHLGGTVACEAFLAKYNAAAFEQIAGFNSAPQVAAWVNTGLGSSSGLTWTYTTAQFTEGSGSATVTHTQSDNNNYPEISFNYSTPKDLSSWRYISAQARTTVAAGGAQSRAVQIRLTSGTAVRIWQVSGTTTTAPFSTEQWHLISGELSTPHATAGTGVFDINNITQISLRLIDGGNKAGTIYWDDVRVFSEMTILEKIYTASGTTNQIIFDPILVFNNGETLLMSYKNNAVTSGEIQSVASGVALV